MHKTQFSWLCNLTHTQRYVDENKFLFSDDNITIDPVVRHMHILITYTDTMAMLCTVCRKVIFGPVLKLKYLSSSIPQKLLGTVMYSVKILPRLLIVAHLYMLISDCW